MSPDLEKLTHELLELPLPVRGELAMRLIRSLDAEEAGAEMRSAAKWYSSLR